MFEPPKQIHFANVRIIELQGQFAKGSQDPWLVFRDTKWVSLPGPQQKNADNPQTSTQKKYCEKK